MAIYKNISERALYGFRKDIQVPEIKLRFNKGKTFGKINSSKQIDDLLHMIYGRTIEIQEQFVVLFMNRQLEILGYYRHTAGTPVSTIVDIPMIMAIALKSMARTIVVAHNHPSGNKNPSQPDKDLTKRIKDSAKSIGLDVLDHIIVTKNSGYYSFLDNGETCLGSLNPNLYKSINNTTDSLRAEIFTQLKRVNKKNAPKMAEIISTDEGYLSIEARIIKMIIHDSITPSACIPQIESEL